jgi:hypothetical protein
MKKYQKGFIIPFLIAIIALTAIGGGVYFYVDKSSNSQIINQDEEIVTVSTTSDSSTNNTEVTSPVPQKTPPPPVANTPVACTMDAMQCPDGTSVGRTGPNCEFVCPTIIINESVSGFIKSAYTKNGKNYVDIDYITFRHESGDMPWSTIINDNPKIRTFEVSANVKISLQNDYINGVSTTGNYIIGFDKFKLIISDTNDIRTNNPWNIVVKDNLIISITENFRS